MRSIFAALAVAVSVATTYAETPTPADGTVSVLKAATVQSPAPASATAPVVQTSACEEARVVKLAPWQVRRLNRVADRQEAREARKCCDACSCKDDCCQKPKTLVLESRRKEKCDCCCK